MEEHRPQKFDFPRFHMGKEAHKCSLRAYNLASFGSPHMIPVKDLADGQRKMLELPTSLQRDLLKVLQELPPDFKDTGKFTISRCPPQPGKPPKYIIEAVQD